MIQRNIILIQKDPKMYHPDKLQTSYVFTNDIQLTREEIYHSFESCGQFLEEKRMLQSN